MVPVQTFASRPRGMRMRNEAVTADGNSIEATPMETGSLGAACAVGIAHSLSRCLRALDVVEAVCKHKNALEEELHALQHKLTIMTIKLASTTAEVSRARYQSFYDGLTSLPNRKLFLSTLETALANRSPLAVLYLDLDGFKSINDLHGHQFGDELLKIVGARLLHGLRARDLACRMGGDEFACLLIDAADKTQWEVLARKLHTMISAVATIGSTEIQVSPSIGIAVYPGDGITALDLLESADVAMYAAKQRRSGCSLSPGPGLVCPDPGVNA